jgi:uncharacterized protein YcbX
MPNSRRSEVRSIFVGRVAELRRYPVKSMLGEMLEEVHVLTRGLPGDRVCALIDSQTGKVASAKLPQRWRRLLECLATFADGSGEIEIVLPDGSHLDAASQSAGGILSTFLGREVKVAFFRPENLELDRAIPDEVAVRGAMSAVGAVVLQIGKGAPEGGFFDAVPIHFVTTASLWRVAEHSLAKVPEPARFRPNIVIDSNDQPPFSENDWVGSTVSIGAELRLKVLLPTPRCAVPTLAHGDIRPDPRLTMEIATLNRAEILDMGMLPCLGAYAQVERAGLIAVGDPVFVGS